jgi:hypothetical protein
MRSLCPPPRRRFSAAVILHRFIADLLAERMLRTLKTVEAVMD